MADLVTNVKMSANGRLVLPKEVRKALGVKGDARLIVTIENGQITLAPMSSIVEKIQRMYRENVVHDMSSDEFLAERRAEARADEARGR